MLNAAPRVARGLGARALSILDAPFACGQPLPGPSAAPHLLRQHGLVELCTAAGYDVRSHEPPNTYFNIPRSGNNYHDGNRAKNYPAVAQSCEALYHRVLPIAQNDGFVLILGGDHSIPLGTIPAIRTARPRTGVVWVDAHADINTTATSPSGNMHGMTVALLMGLDPKLLASPHFSWLENVLSAHGSAACLDPQDIVYVGLREVDPGEKTIIQELGIRAYTMSDIDRKGIGGVMSEVTDYFEKRDMDIHCSYDIDAIDPFWAPHTGTGVMGGLTFRESHYVMEALHNSGRLTSMELVELNPELHPDVDARQTTEVGLGVIGSALGRAIL